MDGLWLLLLLVGPQIDNWIGEIDRAVRSHDNVVRSIKLLVLIMVRDDLEAFAIRGKLDDCAQTARRTPEAMLFIVGAAVRIDHGNCCFNMTVRIELVDFISLF